MTQQKRFNNFRGAIEYIISELYNGERELIKKTDCFIELNLIPNILT